MGDTPQAEITQILVRLQANDIDPHTAADRVFEAAYQELHRLASALMRQERSDHTLRPTALVHEAYIRLVDGSRIEWQSRAHFFGIAARAMRQILVQHARRRGAAKREGGWERLTLSDLLGPQIVSDVKLLRLEEALTQLSGMDERMAKIVELRIFGGMKIKEVAHVLGVSPRTVDNNWSVAKMWLTRELAEGSPS